MQPRFSLSATLLILVAVLAVGGGVATALITSPQSFDLSRFALMRPSLTPAKTPDPSATATESPLPPTLTPDPVVSAVLPIYLPTETETHLAPPMTDTPGPSPTRTATNWPLPLDVWALARITDRVGAT